MSTTTDTFTLDEITHDALTNWPLVVWRLARVAGLTLDDLDAALGKPVALELLSGRKAATVSQFAALAHAVGRRGSDVLQEAQHLPIDWRRVEEGGQILTAVGQLDPHAAAWLASQPADLPDVIGLQPVVNASGRFIGERWVLSVDAALEFVPPTPQFAPVCPPWCTNDHTSTWEQNHHRDSGCWQHGAAVSDEIEVSRLQEVDDVEDMVFVHPKRHDFTPEKAYEFAGQLVTAVERLRTPNTLGRAQEGCPRWCTDHNDADPGQQFHAGREFVPIAPSLRLDSAKALVVIPIVPVGEDVQQWAIDEGKAGGWIDVCTAEPWGDVFCALGVREARAFAAALVRAADQIELGAVDPK